MLLLPLRLWSTLSPHAFPIFPPPPPPLPTAHFLRFLWDMVLSRRFFFIPHAVRVVVRCTGIVISGTF